MTNGQEELKLKRIQTACLNQTLHFQVKPEVPKHAAARDARREYESYKATLIQNNTRHKIIAEKTQDDGSIIVKVKKQLSAYDVGEYLD
jgi:hypothetical protein